MESFIVSNDHVESNCGTSPSSSSMEPKRKRRRIESQEDADGGKNATVKRWRTEKEQQIYSSKLLQALRHVRSRNQSQTTGRGRDVREAADRVLAVSAKGATRWSRALLASSLSLRLKRRHRKVKVAAVIGCNRLKKELKTTEMMNKKKNKKLPVVDMKLRVLGRLIPGCRKASCLNLLEEATDYIAALEMQVRAMAALAEILAAAAQSSPADDRLGANVAS
ncbi:hypothetical protein LWI28_024730 [Acer negundo]|uniref:IBH1-like N-terminal domain-containing protein n=1 Tax=Acer negundo TaxID=4023 RepID=A0AAD5NZ26_ACENE|nr:hypothetical protein LWI28_024730 [Acer negundo]KAK4852843.1 hypothetical protein QYF36_027504 [Acer negundo]